MPSGTVAAAVLAIGDVVWQYDIWQERTRHCMLPFHPDKMPAEMSLSLHKLDSVRALAQHLHNIWRLC